MVVLLVMVINVVFSLFILTLLLLILSGLLVLLYLWNTHYVIRDGYSNNGDRCGTFYINFGESSSTVSWNIGAAL